MTIVGTAAVSHNGILRRLGTPELAVHSKPDDSESFAHRGAVPEVSR